jgi:hypothetical protein
MTQEKEALILYRLERARESLEEASLLLRNGHSNTFVNRLYYACFYAVSALLLSKDLYSAKHSGVRALFHYNFVKSGAVTVELGHIYDKLFRNRQKGDYVDLVHFDVDEVKDWHDEAEDFVKRIEVLIKKEFEVE